MKKLLFILLFIPFFGFSQGGTWPVKYNDSDPSGAPSASGTRLHFNTATNTLWFWEPAPSSTWRKQPKAFDQISGCAAPAYTPTARQSTFAVNSCTVPELYQYTGSAWVLLNPGGTYTAGTGISIASGVITNTGDTNASDDITTATTIGGDLTGTLPNPTVAKIQGRTVSSTAPTSGQVLTYNTGTSQWEPAAPASGGHTIRDDGTDMTQRAALNFVTTSTVSAAATDDSPNGETEVRMTVPTDGITSTEIAADAVGSSEIATDAVGAAEIATGAVGTAEIATNGVANADLRQSAALSVVGNATNATADVADIAAGSDHQVLRRNGTALAFGAVNLASSAAVSGNLPVTNLNSGTSASSTTFWRGDGTWGTPVGSITGSGTSGQLTTWAGSNIVSGISGGITGAVPVWSGSSWNGTTYSILAESASSVRLGNYGTSTAALLPPTSYYNTYNYGDGWFTRIRALSLMKSVGNYMPEIEISEFGDVLVEATSRYSVTFSDGATNRGSLFQYNNSGNWTGTAFSAWDSVIIDVTAKGEYNSNGLTYAQGWLYIVFYNTAVAEDISVRMMDRDGVWRTSTIIQSLNVGGSGYKYYRVYSPNSLFNYLTRIEIKLKNPASGSKFRVAGIRFLPERELSFPLFARVDAVGQQIYGNYTWKNSSNTTTNRISATSDNFLGITSNVGIGLSTSSPPTQKLHVSGNIRMTGGLYDGLNSAGSSGNILTSTGSATQWKSAASILAGSTYTPTGTADPLGTTGDFSYDSNYIYVKTSAGWKRTALSTF